MKVHRIVPKNQTKKIPVFLQHGMIATSGDYVVSGENSLGFLLADNGYDIWFGNVRGSKFSLKHQSLEWNDPHYWDFSFHEMGTYDVPVMIDYMMDKTKAKNLFYIGHSQGGSSGLVMLSSFREFNDHILQAHLLGPASFMGNSPNVANYSGNFVPIALEYFKRFHLYDLLVNNKMYHDWIGWAIERYSGCPQNEMFCKLMYSIIMGKNKNGDECDWRIFKYHHKFLSTTMSMKQLLHYAQLFETDSFRQYDYDSDVNRKIYKSPTPPDYNLKNIKTSVYLYAGAQDAVVGIEDVEHLKHELPNVKKYKRLSNYNHGDLVYGRKSREDIYNDILKAFDNDDSNK